MLFPLLLPLLLPSPLQGRDATLTPTAGAVTVATAIGHGVQVYQCTVKENAVYTWTFQSPEAQLTEPSSGKPLGTHGKGPTWTWSDGSSITGSVLAKTPSPDAGSVPWLLLKTTPVGTASGTLAHVGLVRRSDTKGGEAPAAGCDAAHVNTLLRVPYSATYTFYTVATPPSIPSTF